MSSLPDELSGGEQQRVSIARAVVNRPPLLICDEPTGNLDPDTSVGIMQLLYRINRAGTTVLMATHDREMVDKMRRRVIALEDGGSCATSAAGGTPPNETAAALLRVVPVDDANISTTLAATLTVLIGMFLVGVLLAFGTWARSWSDTKKGELIVKVYFCTARVRKQCEDRSDAGADEGQDSCWPITSREDGVRFVSKDEALGEDAQGAARDGQGAPEQPAAGLVRGHPAQGEDTTKIGACPQATRTNWPASTRSSGARRRRAECCSWRT